MDIHFERSLFIAASPDEVFQKAVLDVSFLEKSVVRFGPIPRVWKAKVLGGQTLEVGAIRQVTLDTGGILNEVVEELESGPMSYRLAYRVPAFPFPFSLISIKAWGEYVAKPYPAGTLFTWRATHSLRSVFVFPVALLFRWLFFQPMMLRYLKNTDDLFRKKGDSGLTSQVGVPA